jgi:hypothetical protein
MIEDLFFYISWFCVFILCYGISHYSFKYVVPVTLFFMKFIYAICLLLLVRLYYLLRVENYEVNWAQIQNDFVSFLNLTAKMEL